MKKLIGFIVTLFIITFISNNVYADNLVCKKQSSDLKGWSSLYVLKDGDKVVRRSYGMNNNTALQNCLNKKLQKNSESITSDSSNLGTELMKGYISSNKFNDYFNKKDKEIKQDFYHLADTWDNGYNGSQIFEGRKALVSILKNIKLISPNLVKSSYDGTKNRIILSLKNNTPEVREMKKMLVDPFENGKYGKSQIYKTTGDLNLGVYQRPNLKMVMGVVRASDTRGQEFIKNRYCDRVLCAYNTNGDLLVYPNLSPKVIKSFNLFNCAYDGKKLDCGKNKVPDGIPEVSSSPITDLPNDTPKKIPYNPKDNPQIPHFPNIGDPIPNPPSGSCGNGKVDVGEECDTTAGGTGNSLEVCNAPGTTNECKFKTPKGGIAKDTQGPIKNKGNQNLYCGTTVGTIISSGGVDYSVVSIKANFYNSGNVLDTSHPGYDILTLTGEYIIIAKSKTGALITKKYPLTYKLKKYYLEFGDFNGDGKFDGEPLRSIIGRNLELSNTITDKINIKNLLVRIDKTKETSIYNMQNKIRKYFLNTDKLYTESYNVISKVNSVEQGNGVCQGSGVMYTINYFKKYGNLTTKPNLSKIDVSFPNLVSVDSLQIQGITNIHSKMYFPSLQKVPLLLKIANDNMGVLQMPVLNEIGGRISKDYNLSNLDASKKYDLRNYVNRLGFFIENSNIKLLNTHNLTDVWKNISIFYSNIENWKNNITRIIPIVNNYMENLYNMGIQVIDRDIVYQWEGGLYMKDNGTHQYMPYNSFHNLKQLGALTLIGMSNVKMNFSSINWIYDGIFLRYANNNDINLMGLSKLGVILANNKRKLVKNQCSDAYVKQFRAANMSSWDLEHSSNNIFHHGNLRYMGFAKDKFTGPFLKWEQTYISHNITHIGISPAYDNASLGNKVDFIQNFTCIGKKWDGKIGNQGLYFYDDSEDWKSPGYNEKYNGLGLFMKLSKLQSYMYVKNGNGAFQRKTIPNEKHLEIVYNMPISKSISPRVLYNIAMKIPGVDTPKPAPWLGQITQDGKEGSVMITLGKPSSSSSNVSYAAYTPIGNFNGSSCIPDIDYNYYCVNAKLYEKDTEYNNCSGTGAVKSVIYDGPYKTRSLNLPSCTNSKTECIASSDYKDALIKSYTASTHIFLSQKVIKNGCVIKDNKCDGKNLIVKYYKDNSETQSNLFQTKVYPNNLNCYNPINPIKQTPIVPVTEAPTKTVDILTYLGSTDLIVNKDSPVIHTSNGTVYGLSNDLWLSRIDTHTRKAYSSFAIKDIFRFKAATGEHLLQTGDTISILNSSGDEVAVGEYTGANTTQGLGIYVPTTGNADSNYYYFPVKFTEPAVDTGGYGNLWTYGPVYLLTCEDSTGTVCHYNDNDYQYFKVNGKEYVVGRYTHPGQKISLLKSDGTVVTAPIKDSYRIFIKHSNGFWQDLGSVLDVKNGANVRLKGATVNDNGTVNLYYTENGTDKAIILSGL